MQKRLYEAFFVRLWPIWISGAILGGTNAVYALVSGRLAGAWGPWRSLASWLEVNLFNTRLFTKAGFSPDLSIGVIAISIVAGSLAASLIGKDFAIRRGNRQVVMRGFLGGILIAVGASVAQGCTVYHFMGGIPSLLFGSFIFFIGVYIGIHYGVKLMSYLASRRT